ncbi:FMN-binding glutamate synthase family protein [Bermanella marisrubri]|uniref:Glutamate synthase domain protein n=1 Tax=Bermanella marisrubri TaxID=207949 RepID=Q1N1E0_9GAMM|nr:FMN-binding glutamate synthase family protein [Bermanella marisrubri]EAT12110.1 glutamate synthase domain protein [Oceanobacter sp. RED65] [Bermanella marisrubri]QIZ83573.1 FMN-binding glutamate synthase family protein [Bermanella marisrubri]
MTIMQSVLFVIATLGNSASFTLYYAHPSITTGFLVLFTSLYTLIGLHDLFISKHSLNRLYPVVAYIRYFLENFRTEIQQYFIANNTEELPFNREQRSLVYQRAKNQRDTIAFGTQHNLLEDNYLSLWPSLSPKKVEHENKRITIGGTQCDRPYDASILNISAMSFGALSAQAIEALNLGAKKGGFYHNTGEGGISPYHLKHGGDLVWQIGSGLFGCRDLDGNFDPSLFTQNARRDNVKMIELKLSQGAKPGHGGVLPKSKISEEIARIRNVPMDQDCISPASHPLAQTPIDLLNNITQLRQLSGGKPVGFKMCVGNPAEFLSICKAMLETNQYPDFITIDGAEGGTGAAPVEFSNRLGMTCLDAVYLVNSALIGCGIRDKITLIASGKTASAFDILTKMAAGANIINAARTMMFAVGCIQSRSCNTNHCPTGVATQDPARGKAIDITAKSERVKNFQRNTLHALFELVGSMGLDDPQAVTANMVKRRTPYGLSISLGAIVPTLKPNSLLQKLNTVDDPWQRWWQQANSESFYVHDDCVLYSPELKMREV